MIAESLPVNQRAASHIIIWEEQDCFPGLEMSCENDQYTAWSEKHIFSKFHKMQLKKSKCAFYWANYIDSSWHFQMLQHFGEALLRS